MHVYSFTRFTAENRLTKYIDRDEKRPGILSTGTAQRTDVTSASELADLINALPSNECLSYGVTGRSSVDIKPREYCTGNAISRTREHFEWPNGAGVLFIDIDGKYDANDLTTLQTALYGAMAALEVAPQVWTRSSSAGVCIDGGEPSKGGIHCYILVADARSIPALGDQLYKSLWLTGHGWHILSNGDVPRALPRCLVDQSVWQPERLDYAAAPVLGDGLTRTGNNVLAVLNNDAEPLGHVEPLTHEQAAHAARMQRESYDAIKPAITTRRKEVIAEAPAERRESIRARQLASDRGEVTADTPLHMASGAIITAGDVLANPTAYAGQRLADPLEPDYGNDSRIAMITDKGSIYSHAHGGQTFRIVREAPQAPADVHVLTPEPSDSAIISACYAHGAYRRTGAMTAVCDDTGASRKHAEAVWQAHCGKQAHRLHQAAPALHVDTFDEALAHIERGENVMIQAALGSGKTDRIGRAVMKRGRRAISVTLLRSLVGTHAHDFGSAHYKAGTQALAASDRISTTVHSLHKVVPDDFGAGDVLLLDEFASISALLFGEDERIMARHTKVAVLNLLADLFVKGVQIVALDGDVTPTAAGLASRMGLRTLKVAETPYAAPAVEMVAHENSGFYDIDRIIRLLREGQHVAIATDSQKRAEALGRRLQKHKPLVITGRNSDNKRQALFLSNVNEGAQRERLVIYSPAVNVGVSITSVEASVFVHQHAGTLAPTGLWQLARRYRRVSGGAIRWHVSPEQLHGQTVPTRRDIQSDHAQMLAQLGRCDESLAPMLANVDELNITRRNPLLATIGHLHNIGVDLTVKVDGDHEETDRYRDTRDELRAEHVEKARTARRAHDDEKLAATDEDSIAGDRRMIERGLRLQPDEFESDGALPSAIVDACLYDGLLTRVRRQAMALSRSTGADLGALDGDNDSEWLFTMKHRNAQADIVADICNELTGDDGRLVITTAKAKDIADSYRARIHVIYSDISKPKGKISGQSALRWLTTLLHGWGYVKAESYQSSEGARERVQVWDTDMSVFKYAVRLVETVESTEHAKWLEAAS